MESINSGRVSSETVRRLLSNALEQFSMNGYEAVSVREITKASAVTKPTLYYYFENKEGLYRQLVQQSIDELLGLLRQALRRGESGSEKAYQLIKEHLNLCRARPYLVRFVYNLLAQSSKPLAGLESERFNKGLSAMIDEITDKAVKSGEIKNEARHFVHNAYHSLIRSRVIETLAGFDGEDELELTEGTVKFIFGGT
jgi:AcrR family transcriptional regulator